MMIKFGSRPVPALSVVKFVKQSLSVDGWINWGKITEDDMKTYPNAKAAAEIKDSPLYKALS